ncbi:replication-associated recombination protein A [Mycoplasmopsis cricetuli]|uniref:replication-associated recombination protein A n=1 Tax=Mycoplasmopsis cricetuli TaxID=171283 RepID=UPI0004713484|nr:replication-associated recombination protein A [Mycoplasmopsis cricetuli]
MKNLANLIRPQTLDDIVGQEHIKILLKEVVKKQITTSFLLFGESGTGKSSIAIALANDLKLSYGFFNAATDLKKQLLDILNSKQIIIIDEIHRLNKDKQDILLPYLEYDKIILYATTTENPYFKVNPALRSRMQILQINKLTETEIIFGLEKNIQKYFPDLKITKKLLEKLAQMSAGDYRTALNNLQMLSLLKSADKQVNEQDLKIIIPNIKFYSDRNGSSHYNNLSALHKSIRGSDVNATLYYGHLIIQSGDFDGLFRRMLAATYEDVGLASPTLALKVKTAIEAYERLGSPEGLLPLTYALIELALSPKSNSVYKALNNSLNIIQNGKIYNIPKHLKDAHYASAVKLGDGIGYLYPHDFKDNWVNQDYLPKEILNHKFFEFGSSDYEQKLSSYWHNIKQRR